MPRTLTGRRPRHAWLLLAITVALAACAPGPDAVAPVAMPGGMYDHLSCNAARHERQAIAANVSALEAQQRGAQAGDAFGVFLIGVPTSSLLGGDVSGKLSLDKGKLVAIDARLARC